MKLSRHKYQAQPTTVDGIRFASKKEARRYSELKLLERAGEIRDLELQPRYPMGTDADPVLIRSKGYPNGRRVTYVADFRYYDTREARVIVEDTKGVDTPASRIKRAFVEWQYRIEVVIL